MIVNDTATFGQLDALGKARKTLRKVIKVAAAPLVPIVTAAKVGKRVARKLAKKRRKRSDGATEEVIVDEDTGQVVSTSVVEPAPEAPEYAPTPTAPPAYAPMPSGGGAPAPAAAEYEQYDAEPSEEAPSEEEGEEAAPAPPPAAKKAFAETGPAPQPTAPVKVAPTETKGTWLMPILIGGGILAIGGIVIYMRKRGVTKTGKKK